MPSAVLLDSNSASGLSTPMCGAMQRFSERFLEDFEIAMRLACLLDPSTVRQTERCPVCELRCKSIAQLQEHIQEKHGADFSSDILDSFHKAAQEKVALLMRAQQQAVQALQQRVQQPNNPIKCHLCAETFTDDVQRHLHVIHNHHSQQKSHASNGVSASTMKEDDVLKCPQPMCDFRTQRAENLAIHLQRHAPLDAALSELQHGRDNATDIVSATSTDTATTDTVRPHHEDEEDDAMQTTTEVALKMVKENQTKPFFCPVGVCGRRYNDITTLEKHIAKVHRWQLKLSPKKRPNGIISPSKIVKLTKRYACQFSKCQQRFATKQLCREHVLSHFRAPAPDATPGSASNPTAHNEPCSSGELDGTVDRYMREEQEHVVKYIHEHLARRESNKEHERHSHTSGSISPVCEQVVAEGFARPVDGTSQKPYIVQSFLMREQTSSKTNGGGIVQQMIAHLPVRTLLTEPVLMTVELVPVPRIDAQVVHL